jgi:hypothetical protein
VWGRRRLKELKEYKKATARVVDKTTNGKEEIEAKECLSWSERQGSR